MQNINKHGSHVMKAQAYWLGRGRTPTGDGRSRRFEPSRLTGRVQRLADGGRSRQWSPWWLCGKKHNVSHVLHNQVESACEHPSPTIGLCQVPMHASQAAENMCACHAGHLLEWPGGCCTQKS